jgi:hypothetical protein
MGQQFLVEIMGNKGKEKDLHIPRKMHILLNRKASIMLKSHQEDVNIQVEKAT